MRAVRRRPSAVRRYSPCADLRSFLDDSLALARRKPVVGVLRALMAEAQINDEFGERFRMSFLQHRRDALGAVLARASDRGDLPRHLRPSTVLDIVFGVIWYRILAAREPADETLVTELITTLVSERS